MKAKLFFLAVWLIFCIALVSGGQPAEIYAVGPPSDNVTIPDFPVSGQTQDEIKPQIPYVRQGPTSQEEDAQPSVIPGFIEPTGTDQLIITGDENWFLTVDINMPGWLYIYEYFPGGSAVEGEWIAYKWELTEGGVWKLGPFIPGDDELEGEHIYRIWFFSNGQWAGEGPDAMQSNRIHWTYIKDQPVEEPAVTIPTQPEEPPVTSEQEESFTDKLHDFFTKPLGIALAVLLLIGVGVLVFFVYRRYFRRIEIEEVEDIEPLSDEAESEDESAAIPATLAGARLALPNGLDIQLTGNNRIIGRSDLARTMSLDELGLISKKHFEIRLKDEHFYIEDLGSSNGTRCNGTDISGKGPVILSDDDIIEPAGVISLKFYLL